MICPACQSETLPYLFCHRCDAYLVNPYEGVRGGVARRLAAHLLDAAAVFLSFILIVGFSKAIAANYGMEPPSILAILFMGTTAYVIFSLWFLARGKTIGKWLVKIIVVDKRNGQNPGLGRMLVREFPGKLASCFIFCLGYLWAIWDRDGQAWHDKIAGTVVLYENPAMLTVSTRQYPYAMAASAELTRNVPAAAPSRSYLIEEPRSTPWLAVAIAFAGALAFSLWGLPKIASWYEETHKPAVTETAAKAPRIRQAKVRPAPSTSELWKKAQARAAIDWAKPTDSVTETFQLGHRSYRWVSIRGVGPNIRIDLEIRRS